MKTPEQMLEEFQATFQTPNTPEFWAKLVEEEQKEVAEAITNLMKEMADLAYVAIGFDNAGGNPDDLPEPSFSVSLFLDLVDAMPPEIREQAFERVHANNMSKVHADGTVRRREDGKVLKPEGYQPCDLSDLVR